MRNSTISSNKAGDYEHSRSPYDPVGYCPLGGEGGGIANTGTLIVENSTVTGNVPGETTTFGSHCIENYTQYFGKFGGLYNEYRGTVVIRNTIVASNTRSDCGGQLTSLGYSLIQNTANCVINGNFIKWGAHLGPLQDNDGPTLTHALNSNSPAIDAGACTDTLGITVTVDQRSEPRPQGDDCDIGAYESPYTFTFEIRDIKLPLIGR